MKRFIKIGHRKFNLEKISRNVHNFYICIIYKMPSPIKMSLTNGNLAQVQFEALTRSRLAAVPVPKKNAPLKAPMIGRIHNVRPGCGSCGH